MRVGIVLLSDNKILKYLSKKITSKLMGSGHTVTNITKTDLFGINSMQYMIFIVDSGRIFDKGKFESLSAFIKKAGNIKASHASLFTNVRPFILKTFVKYMNIIENAGFILQDSDTLKNNAEADIIVDRIAL